MKAQILKRIEKRREHFLNLQHLPDPEYRLTGWLGLTKFTGYSREIQLRWIALDAFPKPKFYYIRIDDTTRFRKGVWRKVAIWDKREVSAWFETAGPKVLSRPCR